MSNGKTHVDGSAKAALCGLPYRAAKYSIAPQRFQGLLSANGKDWFCQRCSVLVRSAQQHGTERTK